MGATFRSPAASSLSFPVVFAFSGNPVDAGIVKSFARTETNFTGVSFLSLDLAAKRIELLKELAPNMRRLGVLARPEHAGEHRERAASEEAAAKLGLGVFYAPIQGFKDLEPALRSIGDQKCDSLVTFPDASHAGQQRPYSEHLRRKRVSPRFPAGRHSPTAASSLATGPICASRIAGLRVLRTGCCAVRGPLTWPLSCPAWWSLS